MIRLANTLVAAFCCVCVGMIAGWAVGVRPDLQVLIVALAVLLCAGIIALYNWNNH
jgi:ribose/xylose/arabinose/galactoside ABC-type transport system permease subunit